MATPTSQLAQSSPENVVKAPKGSVFTRNGDKFYLTVGGTTTRLATTKKAFAIQYQNEIWYPTLNEDTITFATEGETWVKSGNGDNKTGWTQLSKNKSKIAKKTVFTVMGNMAEVYANSYASFFLKTNGDLWASGYGSDGELGLGFEESNTASLSLTNVKKVCTAIYNYATLAIKNDDTIWATGDGGYEYQFGNGTSDQYGTWTQINLDGDITGSGKVIDISVGYYTTMFLMEDNSLWGCGDDLGFSSSTPVQIATNVKSIIAGGYHNLYVKNDDTLWGFGYNSDGELGTGNSDYHGYDDPVQIDTNVKSAGAGGYHTLYIKNDDALWGTGYNYYGELGLGDSDDRYTPAQIDTNVRFVTGGDSHTLYIKNDNTLWGMGYNYDGQIGAGDAVDEQHTPILIDTNVSKVDAGDYHSLYIKTDKTAYGMGYNSYYELGSTIYPAAMYYTDGTGWVSYADDQFNSYAAGNGDEGWYDAIYAGGKFVVGGVDSVKGPNVKYSSDGVSWQTGSMYAPGYSYVNNIAYGNGKFALVTSMGDYNNGEPEVYTSTDVVSWESYSLGDTGASSLRGIAYGNGLFVAGGNSRVVYSSDAVNWDQGTRSFDGYMYAIEFGNGTYVGATGNGTYNNSDVSVYSQSFNGNTADNVSVGNTSAYLLKNGTLYGCGNNYNGQIGTGQTYADIVYFLPITSNVRNVASGRLHVNYVKNDSTLWGVGDNEYNQLNNGDSYIYSPVQIDTNVSQSYGGEASNMTVYIKNDGTLWGRGWNGDSALADYSVFGAILTQSIQIDTNVKQASVGYNGILYVKNDGMLWGRGRNEYGQLGTGDTSTRTTSIQIDTDVVSCVAAGDTSYYIKTDGSLYGMGFNTDGQLGLGDNTHRNTATQITSSGVLQVAATYGFSQYVNIGNELYSAGWNGYGQLGLGDTTSRNVHTLVPISGVSKVAAGYAFSYIIKNDGTVWSTGQDGDGQLGTNKLVFKGTYSTDGVSWSSSFMPNFTYSDVAYGNGKFVMVSDYPFAISSTDGINWTSSYMNTSSYMEPSKITFDGTKFVCATYSNNDGYDIYTSTDGIGWTRSKTGVGTQWGGIAYGNGKYVIAASNLPYDSIYTPYKLTIG
jgi:hypothetical protein